jgi:parvulin-like peptidyl-prolyl isomerase
MALVGLAGLVRAQGMSSALPPAVATGARSPEQAVAVLEGGQIIPLADLEAALRVGGSSVGPVPEPLRRQHQIEVLGRLIDSRLLRLFLEKEAPPVSNEEVERRLGEMQNGLNYQGKSLEEFCHDTNQTLAQLRSAVADHLRWSKWATTRISDADLESYYRANKDYFDEVKVRASHVVIQVPQVPTEAPPADKQRAESEKARARAQLLEWRQQLLEGKTTLEELAKGHAGDPLPVVGGELGPFPRKWFNEAFERIAFALPVGEVSDVVETEYGLHIIKVTERQAGNPSDFARIKEKVREALLEEKRQQILNEKRREVKIQPFDLP